MVECGLCPCGRLARLQEEAVVAQLHRCESEAGARLSVGGAWPEPGDSELSASALDEHKNVQVTHQRLAINVSCRCIDVCCSSWSR